MIVVMVVTMTVVMIVAMVMVMIVVMPMVVPVIMAVVVAVRMALGIVGHFLSPDSQSSRSVVDLTFLIIRAATSYRNVKSKTTPDS
jgi:hypothetical protein